MSSTAAPTIGYGPLEAFLGAEEGVSFKTDNDQFLCPSQRQADFTCIEVVTNKVQSCKFFVEYLGNARVRLMVGRGFYLSRTDRHGRHPIEVLQMEPDTSCVFLVSTRNGNVIFQCDNGLFLSRVDGGIYRCLSTLEAAETQAEVCCEFVPDIGDAIRPSFEIALISCISPRKIRVTVSEKEYINSSSLALNHTFNLTWERKFTEVTTWVRAWGLNTVISADATCIDSRSAVTVWYDGVHGKSSSKEKIISDSETVRVIIPPKTTITAKLMVSMNDQAGILFIANIKKIKVNGEVETFTETGTWKGVIYDSIAVAIEESHFPWIPSRIKQRGQRGRTEESNDDDDDDNDDDDDDDDK